MLKDCMKEYFVTKKNNCAKAILLGANDYYHLELTPKSIELVSAFGGGMGCGKSCGALCGGLAALGVIFEDADKETMKAISADFVKAFEKTLGHTDCDMIKPDYFKEGVRCLEAVELCADTLEHLVKKYKEDTGEESVLTAEEIKQVKGLGFLQRRGTDTFNCRVITRNGKITAQESKCIAEAAEKFGNGEVAMTGRLTIEIQGVPYGNIQTIRDFLAKGGLETGGTGSKVRPVVACKGTTCQYGLCDTFGISEEIHNRFYKGYSNVKLPHKFKIALGGCPNNCVKPNLNDIGVIGQRTPVLDAEKCKGCKKCGVVKGCPIGAAEMKDGLLHIDESKCNHCGLCVDQCSFGALSGDDYSFRIDIGGRWGKKIALGRSLNQLYKTPEEVYDVLEKIILLYREQGKTGERFADTIARLGFANVEKQLLDDDLLKRKNKIIDAEIHLAGGATC